LRVLVIVFFRRFDSFMGLDFLVDRSGRLVENRLRNLIVSIVISGYAILDILQPFLFLMVEESLICSM